MSSDDLSQQLKERAPGPEHALDMGRLLQRAERRQRRQFGLGLALVSSMTVVLLAVIVMPNRFAVELEPGGVEDRAQNRVTAVPHSSEPARPGAPASRVSATEEQRLPAPPIGGRYLHSAVWDGSEMIIWGGLGASEQESDGFEERGDGAAYDPVARRWRVLSPSPLGARAGHTGVWTGAEMLIIGGFSGDERLPTSDAAAYDPDEDTWRLLPAPPTPPGEVLTAWTGQELVLFAPAGEETPGLVGAALDPLKDVWHPLPPPPLPPAFASTILSMDGEVYMLGSPTALEGAEVRGNGAVLNVASAQWSTLPSHPLVNGMLSGVQAEGNLIVLGANREAELGAGSLAIRYDPATQAWQQLASPEAPLEAPPLFWNGRAIAAWDAQGVYIYDPSMDRWERHESESEALLATVVDADGRLIRWGGLVASVEGVEDAGFEYPF